MNAMDTAWIRICVLAMMTSLTCSTKHNPGESNQQLLSKSQIEIENATRYIDLSVSLLGENFSQYKQYIINATKLVNQVFQRQLNTNVILSNIKNIPTTPSLQSSSDKDALEEFKVMKDNSTSDSSFLIRFSSSSSVESTLDTLCSSVSGGVISVVTMDNIDALSLQIMYGLGKNLGFKDHNNMSEHCRCEDNKEICVMDNRFKSNSSFEYPLIIKVSNCNVNQFSGRNNVCLEDQPKQFATCEDCGCPTDVASCKECSNSRCCRNCKFVRGCNSRDCICKNTIGQGSTAAPLECLEKLSAFCGTHRNCSKLNYECDILICQADDISEISQSVNITNVSIQGSSTCSNLYALASKTDDGLFITDGAVCSVNMMCISEKCESTHCLNRNGDICSNNGKCDKSTNKCLCDCEWSGRVCNIPSGKSKCRSSAADKPGYTISGLKTTHIIAALIGIIFTAAVISGATSLGYKRLQKRNRLQTKHERNMLSLFEPTRDQKRRLARQYNKRSDHEFQYNERYRIPNDTNVEQRLMDEGMPPPILCTAAKHSSRDVSVI